jgi:hypothetical protein
VSDIAIREKERVAREKDIMNILEGVKNSSLMLENAVHKKYLAKFARKMLLLTL